MSESEKYEVLEKIGTFLINPRYQLTANAIVGHGSFGVIHKVRRKSDGLVGIVSVMIDDTSNSIAQVLCRKEISYTKMTPKEREQLQAELAILKELRHPNIVRYFEREHHKATQDLHLYMEYCGNGDLGQMIKRLKRLNQYADEEFVWSVFSQLVTALYRCHYGEDPPEVGRNVMGLGKDAKPIKSKQSPYMILHRDLKPENGKCLSNPYHSSLRLTSGSFSGCRQLCQAWRLRPL